MVAFEVCIVVLSFCKHKPAMREPAIVQGLLGNSDLNRWETIGGQARRLNWVTHSVGLVAARHIPQMPRVSLVKVVGGASGSEMDPTAHWARASSHHAFSEWMTESISINEGKLCKHWNGGLCGEGVALVG
jgi:hypothetical protein